mmetsp:Transcript_54992/g.46371  ORF Transcript_54992/g.46371 Transcript_54992/m.46371 type:complete len:183 (+) Transcript_54992:270-818(+)
MGNTIVLKGADCCTESTLAIENIFIRAGWSKEVQAVIIGPEEGDIIISHPSIRGVSFTGSTKVGRIIAEKAGKNLKKCVMELGGSDPFIVREDADVDFAIELLLKSRIPNAGQICMSAKRMIIHENLYDSLKSKLISSLQQLEIGDPMNENIRMGPLARKDILDLLIQQIKDIEDSSSGKVI